MSNVTVPLFAVSLAGLHPESVSNTFKVWPPEVALLLPPPQPAASAEAATATRTAAVRPPLVSLDIDSSFEASDR
jgi:hypothetical protein